ncbi:VOC family protein [Xanthobacter versatilis]|uniref:VOC family protein n=1 Tax=Xanthobacter autotrophicus (strain ATCC BAA-1158 / Py2) TaxID=78245 RepID=UPI00372D0565
MATTTEVLISVSDVTAASGFYCELLEIDSDHGGIEFDRLVSGGAVVLLLRKGPPPPEPGAGVFLYFRVDDLDRCLAYLNSLELPIDGTKQYNPISHQFELRFRDSDGYQIVLCQK